MVETGADRSARLSDELAGAWLTYPLSAPVRARLAAIGQLRAMTAGEVLMQEGGRDHFLGLVLRGRVGLRVRVPERGPVTVLTVEPGDVIGWSAVVPPHHATSTAVALVDGELAIFDGDELRAALATDAQLAAEFYPILLQAVARRLEGTRLQLLDLFSQRWTEPW